MLLIIGFQKYEDIFLYSENCIFCNYHTSVGEPEPELIKGARAVKPYLVGASKNHLKQHPGAGARELGLFRAGASKT